LSEVRGTVKDVGWYSRRPRMKVGQVSASLPATVHHCDDCAAPRLFLALCLDGHSECLDLICADCGAAYVLVAPPRTDSVLAAHAPSALRDVA
jgi:hypothetical protein